MPALYLATGRTAGEEISSTYEGRHVTLEESLITHPTHADGFVDKGDPVIFGGADGHGVGIAFTSAAAATDYIALDTEGIWFLSVVATDDAGNSAVDEGDIIYINRSTCILSKIADETTQIPFGYALGDLTGGTTGVCAVKVHWDPIWWDRYRSLSGSGNDNAWSKTIADTGTAASGGNYGLKIDYAQAGDKTGTAEVNGLGVDITSTQDVPYAYNIALYQVATGNPALGLASGLSIYFDELGTGVVNRSLVDLGKVSTNNATGRDTFFRCREHGTVVGKAVMMLEGGNNLGCATYLVDLENGGGAGVPFILAAVGGDQTAKIAVCWNGTPYYIPLHTA